MPAADQVIIRRRSIFFSTFIVRFAIAIPKQLAAWSPGPDFSFDFAVTPSREDALVESTTVRFARAARELSRTSRLCGVTAPSFISPPRRNDLSRTIRRRPNGTVVAVSLRARPWAAVLADMIDGVIAANGLHGVDADRVRSALWHAVGEPAVESEAA